MGPPAERFWKKVVGREDPDGCWLWTAGTWGTTQKCGRFRDGEKSVVAHRWAYEQAKGPIPEGLVIDHLCRTPLCVNPAHLEAVTNRENVLRGVGYTAEKARQTHCIHGHEFTPENTRYSPSRPNSRECLTCKRQRAERKRSLLPPKAAG